MIHIFFAQLRAQTPSKAFSKEMSGMVGKWERWIAKCRATQRKTLGRPVKTLRWARGEDENIADSIPNTPANSTTGPAPPKVAPQVNSLISKASKLKTKGNKFFKSGNLTKAIVAYSTGIEMLRQLSDNDVPNMEVKEVYTKLISNRAACHLQLGKNEMCEQDCSSILDTLSPRM